MEHSTLKIGKFDINLNLGKSSIENSNRMENSTPGYDEKFITLILKIKIDIKTYNLLKL